MKSGTNAQLKRHRRSAEPSTTICCRVLLTVRGLPPARYPADQWAVAKSLFRVLSRALVELQFVFAEHSQCDFTELSLLARHALGRRVRRRRPRRCARRAPPASARRRDAGHLHRPVRPHRDAHANPGTATRRPSSSSAIRASPSISSARRASSASCAPLAPGSSATLPLTRLQLTANFRSQGDLVARFNQDFALIFPQPVSADPYALPYAPADATLPASPNARGLVWHTHPLRYVARANSQHQKPRALSPTSPSFDTTRLSATPARFAASRRVVCQAAARPAAPSRWNLAVLVRSRSHLAEIVAEFESEKLGKIPYRAVEITPLNERQEVLDLTALTRAILHPADRVAALAVLCAPHGAASRSPTCTRSPAPTTPPPSATPSCA